jgi:hypothetical protein
MGGLEDVLDSRQGKRFLFTSSRPDQIFEMNVTVLNAIYNLYLRKSFVMIGFFGTNSD